MITDEQLAIITRKAHQVANSWPDCDPTELAQELCLKWIESWNRWAPGDHVIGVRDYWEDEDQHRGMSKLNSTLANWANTWCRKETIAVRGHDDFARYGRNQLKLMLPLIENPAAWGSLSAHGGGRSSKPAREGGDSLATYADLTRAWEALSEEDRHLLGLRYVYELDDWARTVMEQYECTEASARTRTSRALANLERELAGRPKHVGRRAMSNAASLSVTARSY